MIEPVQLTEDNVLQAILDFTALMDELPASEPKWMVLPSSWVEPRRSRGGRRSKKRVQKKKIIVPVFLKGTRWWRG